MKKWKEEKRDISHQRSAGGECAVAILKEAIVQLPRVIHGLDHLRLVEIQEQNNREEERDCEELRAWREQHLHLETIIKEQTRDTVAKVAQLWKSSPSTSEELHTVVQAPVADALKSLEEENSTLAPVISSEGAVTMALPSKLPPLPSTLPPLQTKLPPLPSKLPPLSAKLPPLNLPLRRAFCNPVAPLPPIHRKTAQEDLESISEHSKQSAVAEHLMVTPDADGPEATSTCSSESLEADDNVEQEREKKRSFKKRFFQFLKKLNCCSAKED
ncbi:uncharacterized protein LOC134098328 [Sardina pilchardus]|uniref:uncharacterized protein LOC134098328 n=1 Tax=Sardina pilchardus TaxID=27697 RepID=UPI002E0D6E96